MSTNTGLVFVIRRYKQFDINNPVVLHNQHYPLHGRSYEIEMRNS